MTAPDERVRIDALRALFAAEPITAADEVVEIADRHAGNRELVYDAVLLRRDFIRAQGADIGALVERADGFLNTLAADLEQPASRAQAETRQITVERARTTTLRQPIRRGVVFQSSGLGKSFGPGKFALTDVAIELRFGGITGVVGLNGNGKTTLFRLVVGDLRPTAGTMSFPGLQKNPGAVRWNDVWRQLAYVPQDLPKWYGSLRTNLHYEAALHGLRGAENEREVEFIIERLGLTNQLENTWEQLSGGFKLRFALARALVWKPKLLVLDEPLANLDIEAQQTVLKDLRHLTDSLRHPLGVLVSSQHLHEIEEISNDILYLRGGVVDYYGAVGGIGATRARNTFELGGRFDLATLERVLEGPKYQSIYYNGIAFVVLASLDVSAPQVLHRLFNAGLEVDYFRDVSRSVKSLFNEPSRVS